MNSCGNRPAPALNARFSSLRTVLCAPSDPTRYFARTVVSPSAADSRAVTPAASWVRPRSSTPRSIVPPRAAKRSVRMRSVSYCGSPRWAYGSSGRSHSTRWVWCPLTTTIWPLSQMPASIASWTMPWSSQISIVRQCTPMALSAWPGGSVLLSTSRQATPRRASSMARVRPVGPAPTTSTSVAASGSGRRAPATCGRTIADAAVLRAAVGRCCGAAPGLGRAFTPAASAPMAASGLAPAFTSSSGGRATIEKMRREKPRSRKGMSCLVRSLWFGSPTQARKACSEAHSASRWNVPVPGSCSSSSRTRPATPRMASATSRNACSNASSSPGGTVVVTSTRTAGPRPSRVCSTS